MKIKRKTELTVHAEKILMIKRSQKANLALCADCGRPMVSPEKAAIFGGIRTRQIYREIENGERHFIEIENGELLVCFG